MTSDSTSPASSNPADPAEPGANAAEGSRMRAFSLFVWRNRTVWFLIVVVLGAGIDQASKIWAQATLAEEKDVTPRQIDEGEIAGGAFALLNTPAAPERLRVRLDESASLTGPCNKDRVPFAREGVPDGYTYDAATNSITLKGACVPASAVGVGVQYRYADRRFVPTRTITVIPKVFNFMYAENPAAAFSLTSSLPSWLRRPFLKIVSAVATVFISVFFFRLRRPDGLLMTAFALIVAGAIGNLIDRVRFGYVVDFLDAYAGFLNETWRHWPTFNIADACIVVGALSVVWRTMRPLYPEDEPTSDGAVESE